jgi:glutaredoxin
MRLGKILFVLSYCPFCKKAIKYLEQLGCKDVEIVIVDDQKSKFQDELVQLSRIRSFPQLFINGNFFGDSNVITAMKTCPK